MQFKKSITKSFGVLSKALKITRGHKIMWWLGFFIILTQNFAQFIVRTSTDQEFQESVTEIGAVFLNEIIRFTHQYPEKSLLIALISSIILILIYNLFQASILLSIKKILRKEKLDIKNELNKAKQFAGKMFFMDFFVWIFILSILIILGLPIYLFGMMGINLASNLMLLGAILIFIPVALITYLTRTFAQIYLVQHNLSIKESLRNAYVILGKNIKLTILFFFVLVGLLLCIELAMLILLGIGYWLHSPFSFVIILILVLDIILKSAIIIFHRCCWVILFEKITLKKEEIQEKSLELLIQKSKEITPDQVINHKERV